MVGRTQTGHLVQRPCAPKKASNFEVGFIQAYATFVILLLKMNKDTYRLCVCSAQRSKSVAACITDATHNIPKLIHVSNTRELLVEFHRSKGDQPRRPRATGRGKVGCKVLFEASTLSKIRFSHIDARETERVM